MICVLYAMQEEVAALREHLSGKVETTHAWARVERGTFKGHDISLVHCGAGKVLSSITAQKIIDALKPNMLLLCGLSGGLHPDYERGDMVIGTEFIQHDIVTEVFGFERGQIPFTDYKLIPATAELLARASSLRLSDAKVYTGRILSGDQFIRGDAGRALRADLQGDVVDMESAAVAFVCHLNKVPFAVARTISDKADHEAIEDFSEFLARASIHVNSFVEHMVR